MPLSRSSSSAFFFLPPRFFSSFASRSGAFKAPLISRSCCMVRDPNPLRQRRAASRQIFSPAGLSRSHSTVPSRSASTAPIRVSCRAMPPRSARRFTRANIVSAITLVMGTPSIALRSSGVILATVRWPSPTNSAAWLRTPPAIAANAPASMSRTICSCSASAASDARMRCISSAARAALRSPAGVGGLSGVVRCPHASSRARKLSVPSMTACGLAAASSSHASTHGHSCGHTSRMCACGPGSIARKQGQSHSSEMIAIERTADMQ
mmetsp:Transcript_16421/g.49548  ORF Transcript_16421/g.49548 Transcript_16421/m.49548 type:complete len:266 (-) Transcript_16421:624-1421(-)